MLQARHRDFRRYSFLPHGVWKRGSVIDPKGRVFNVVDGGHSQIRSSTAYLRDHGNITKGTSPYGKRDRSLFLQRLDDLIQAAFKGQR